MVIGFIVLMNELEYVRTGPTTGVACTITYYHECESPKLTKCKLNRWWRDRLATGKYNIISYYNTHESRHYVVRRTHAKAVGIQIHFRLKLSFAIISTTYCTYKHTIDNPSIRLTNSV